MCRCSLDDGDTENSSGRFSKPGPIRLFFMLGRWGHGPGGELETLNAEVQLAHLDAEVLANRQQRRYLVNCENPARGGDGVQ